MTGTAQKKDSRPWASLLICIIAALGAFVLLPDAMTARYFMRGNNGAIGIFYICSVMPFLAALLAYSLTSINKKDRQRRTAHLFLFFFSLPAFFFIFIFTALASSLSETSTLSGNLLNLFCILLAWIALNVTVYLTYTRLVQIPTPRFNSTFRWLHRQMTLKNFFLSLYVLLIAYACYAVHPRAYFYYQTSKAERGDISAQLWVAKKFEYPPVRRLFGETTNYTQKNINKARDWYEKAATQGSMYAYGRLSYLYLHQPELVRAEEKRNHLEIALEWAKKADNKNTIDQIQKIISTPPAERHLYPLGATRFADMSSSPIYGSSGLINLLTSFFWLLAGGLLNIAVFYVAYRLLRKRYAKQVIFVALSWPLFLGAFYTVIKISSSTRLPRYFEIVPFTSAAFLLFFSLCMLAYITLLRRTPEHLREKKAATLAAKSFALGLLSLAMPYFIRHTEKVLCYGLGLQKNSYFPASSLNSALAFGVVIGIGLFLYTYFSIGNRHLVSQQAPHLGRRHATIHIYLPMLGSIILFSLPFFLATGCSAHLR